MTSTIPTWHTDNDAENAMGLSHSAYWRRMIDLCSERDLSNKRVLDFGCNQGGFLRLLYALRPFRSGVGLDVATDSIARANALKSSLPVEYDVAGDLARWAGQFDVAFSYEVVYLIPDLAGHAAAIAAMLRPGGVYYPVTGSHTGSPFWHRWRHLIAEKTNLAVQGYSLNDIGDAFAAQGLEVSARKFSYDGFIKYRPAGGYYESFNEVLDYYTEIKTIFRVAKPA
ncbi:class I SAM-dependent methyltransferase (plasmid) [Nitrobacteraceae bacterium UC4446_H13]